jgi:hypothetical protein
MLSLSSRFKIPIIPTSFLPLFPGRSLNEWGVAARILRLFNAPFRPALTRNLDGATRYQFLLLLHALNRICLSKPLPAVALSSFNIQSISLCLVPHPTIDVFRGAARRIIDLRLRTEDGTRREAWSQISDMLDGERR